jgi:hypothetical protein
MKLQRLKGIAAKYFKHAGSSRCTSEMIYSSFDQPRRFDEMSDENGARSKVRRPLYRNGTSSVFFEVWLRDDFTHWDNDFPGQIAVCCQLKTEPN